MKILLVYPPQQKNRGGLVPSYIQQDFSFLYPPLGLLYLASNLDRKKHKVKILDAAASKLSIHDCVNLIKEFEPDVLGITVLTEILCSAKEIAKGAKILLPNLKVVLGGPHINIYPYETMAFNEIDFCLLHFAEYSFALLLKAIENNSGYQDIPGLFYKKNGQIIRSEMIVSEKLDLNALMIPDRRLIDYKRYFTVVDNQVIATAITSRGCPYQCTFCDVFQKDYLFRSPENIIEEIKDIVKLGIRSVHFFDDNFNLLKDRVMNFCELLLKENIDIEWAFRGRVVLIDDAMARLLYRAGCRRVQLGIESSNQETLKIIKKNINLEQVKKSVAVYKRNKILTLGYFIVGFPHESYEECIESAQNAMRLGFDYIELCALTPYPNTQIYHQLVNDGVRDHWLEFAKNPKHNYEIPSLHSSISRDKLGEIVDSAYKKFYFSPHFFIKELLRTRTPRALSLKAKAALKIFSTMI